MASPAHLKRHLADAALHQLRHLRLGDVHGLLAGTDGGSAWMRLIYVVSVGVVALLIFIRFFAPPSQSTCNQRATRLPALIHRRRSPPHEKVSRWMAPLIVLGEQATLVLSLGSAVLRAGPALTCVGAAI